jgi:hypothetical protein
MALFKKLGKAVKKAVGGGAVASSQRMAPAMRGAVASMPDRMPQQSPSMPETGLPATNTYSGRTLARMPETSFPETNTYSGRLSSVISRQRPLGDAFMKGVAPAMSNPNVYKTMQPTVEKAAVGSIAGNIGKTIG